MSLLDLITVETMHAKRLPTFIKKKETKNKIHSKQYFQEDSDESSYEKV